MVPMMIPIEDPVMGFCGGSSWVPAGTMARIAVRGLPIATFSRLLGATITRLAVRGLPVTPISRLLGATLARRAARRSRG